MQYCNQCKVSIRGSQEKCPLCQNPLSEKGKEPEEIYPEIPLAFEHNLAIKIVVFISIVAIVISFAVYNIIPSSVNWPMFVLLGLLSMWLIIIVLLKKRHNMAKNIMWLVTIISVLSVFWDWKTEWRGWSLDFVIPITCVAAMLAMYVTAKVMKLGVRDYVFYFLLDGLFGIIPIAFYLFGWLRVVSPSIICIAFSIIFLAAILIFQADHIKSELSKRMHL